MTALARCGKFHLPRCLFDIGARSRYSVDMATLFEPADFRAKLSSLQERSAALKGFFDVENRARRLTEIEAISQSPDFWQDNNKAREVLRERATCERAVSGYREMEKLLADAEAALELAADSKDEEFIKEVTQLTEKLEKLVEKHEFECKMSGELDRCSAILDLNGGAGGTEAQDWAQMLLRMYTRWADKKGFTVQELDFQPGEVAGIKSATLLIEGDFAYGHLRGEAGVHRLVRISPFDSNARRHTSFASVSVTPDIDQDIEVQINESDLRIDTYRAGGAGGQHVNRTDSAVRITHEPTGIVVQCQNERSQHKNKDLAMKILKSKLYELQRQQQEQKMEQIQGERKKIEWGSQIRSYVLQPYRLAKDLRTDYETSSVDAVLDGEIDPFIEAYLLSAENKSLKPNASGT